MDTIFDRLPERIATAHARRRLYSSPLAAIVALTSPGFVWAESSGAWRAESIVPNSFEAPSYLRVRSDGAIEAHAYVERRMMAKTTSAIVGRVHEGKVSLESI
jgi:hypothetical protein